VDLVRGTLAWKLSGGRDHIFVLIGTIGFLFRFWLLVLFMVYFVLWVLDIDGLCVDRIGGWVVHGGREIRWRREGMCWGIILAAEKAKMQKDLWNKIKGKRKREKKGKDKKILF
jgi:hypothetical protein